MVKLFANWKTTFTGLTMIIGSVVHLVFAVRAGTADENTWTTSLLAIVGGVGLFFAGDASKSADAAELKDVQNQMKLIPPSIERGDTTQLRRSMLPPVSPEKDHSNHQPK